jgi:hypothetical protein
MNTDPYTTEAVAHGLHGSIFHKVATFITTAVITPKPTKLNNAALQMEATQEVMYSHETGQ